jgi:hypothetical protein
MGERGPPFAGGLRFPFLLDVAERQAEQFARRLVMREVAARLDHFPNLHVEAFDRVRGVEHPADVERIGQGRPNASPVAFPDGPDGRMPLAERTLTEARQGRTGRRLAGRLIDRPPLPVWCETRSFA